MLSENLGLESKIQHFFKGLRSYEKRSEHDRRLKTSYYGNWKNYRLQAKTYRLISENRRLLIPFILLFHCLNLNRNKIL